MAKSCEFEPAIEEGPSSVVPEVYLKLCGGSPELKPLPPLPKQSFHGSFEANFDEEFYSPKGFNSSSKRIFDGEESENFGMKSCTSSYPDSNSPENSVHHSLENAGSRNFASSPSRDSDVSVEIMELAQRTGHLTTQARKPTPPAPPPPPPPATARSWASSGCGPGGPPALVPPSGPVVFRKSGPVGERESNERKEEMLGKPKLKALHWDKVRARSDRVMVWDQLHPGSFQLNEEMIETLFKANGPNMGGKDGARRSIMPFLNEETRVLDPKKSQNIAILLRALNVTEGEVCEALLEGHADTLGTELLESLLKMAPTKEEERNLKEYKDESPLKLGPAEKFLKAVLDVPFAFKRVDAMLYMATFDSEVEYLRRSFDTLEAACQELRNSRMFLKLLEAVLKTGNRMNVGTNRGDAQAFKLDTLLKLVDIKGTDGKTTLLHFVVLEIIKAEGSRLAQMTDTSGRTHDPSLLLDDLELRKRGLEVVSGLGGELMNVRKAATMDSEALSSDVAKLAWRIVSVNEVLQLNKEAAMNETNNRFSESMSTFLKKAEQEILKIQSQESGTFSRVKELTEYFHGNSAKEEAHPLRIFMVVRDFLTILDQVCKEVGKINERTIISSTRLSFVPVNQTTPAPFPKLHGTTRESSSDDEDSSLTCGLKSD